MDGVHDIGGVQGYGPVSTEEPEVAFKTDWEARMWGINKAVTSDPAWTLDWWRHVRELIDPLDYLTRPYFDQWMQIYAALLVDSGHATVAELGAGKAANPGPDVEPPMGPDAVARAATRRGTDYRRDGGPEPGFAVGTPVRARAHGAPGHTRLPGYVMGRPGVIEAYRGNYVLPDASARGEVRAEPLYSVAFLTGDLWPNAERPGDRVLLDLWESYLER